MYAIRNVQLCTKDCLCLYVCPTGATNTETGQIDSNKCIGCGLCVQTCPSHAISFMVKAFPKQQPKNELVADAMTKLTQSQCEQEKIAQTLKQQSTSAELARLFSAFEQSKRIIGEDMARESGYMLPQSANTRRLLQELAQNPPSTDFPVDAAGKLLELIIVNEPYTQ